MSPTHLTDTPAALEADPLRERIAAMAAGATIETSVRHVADLEADAALLRPGTPVHLAWVPGTPADDVVTAATRLRQAGMTPVPHISARELAGVPEAEALLGRLAEEAGAHRAMLIAGDAPGPRGPFADSVALLHTGLLESHGFSRLGIAGYPEGHPKIGAPALLEALEAKTAYAREHGLELVVVSQFCFDGAVIVDWVRGLRDRGIDLPVRIGVSGPAKLGTLVRYGLRCGIGNSLRFLGSRARQVGQLVSTQGPEAIVLELARADPELGIAGLHMFSFGGFATSARWLRQVAAGEFRVGEGDGFRVLDG